MSPAHTHHSPTHNQSSYTMPSQTLHTPSPLHNRHSLLMDDVSSVPKGLDGREPTKNKKGRPGKSSVNGGMSGLSSGSESSQDEDEDDDDDDADEEDGEKPAVDSPAKQSSPAGPHKKRKYETSSQIDELEYPRKKTTKKIATNTQGILAYEEKTDDDNDIYGNMPDDDDDCGTCSEAEEAGMAEEFAMDDDILRELGIITDNTMPAENNAMPLLPSEDISFMFDNNGEPIQADPFNNLFDDLDGEIFDAMHRDPERFNDIPAQSNFDWSSFGLSNDADLFSVHPTPIATPDATPRASISAASGYTAASASGNETSSSEDEEIGLSPFFEKGGAALKNLVSTERGNWTDGTDDEAELVKFFFSSADETSSSGESGDETNDETDDDDDITDVEDNLPIPVPPSKSKLRRASQPSGTRPQIVDLNDNGPELCSWVADPMRPICVVEGDKQTFLIPKSGVDYMGNDSASEWAAVDDSESEQSMPAFDPAFTGLLNLGDASGLNGLNFEISDAFLNFQEGEGDITDIYSGEDYGLDDYEAGLDIDAFLDISTDEEANREHGISEAEQGDFDDEECTPTAKNQDAFDLWGKVGVTAFRKRQIQHTQKHSALHGTGYNKGKDIPDTITPKKKQKRVRQRFLASNNAAAQKSSKA